MINKLLIPLSGYPIFKIQTKQKLTKDEIKFIKNLKLTRLINGHTQITKNADIFKLKKLKTIKDLVWKYFCDYIDNIIQIENQFYFCNSWATIQQKGDSHPCHNHENAIFSSVYYGHTKTSSLTFHLDKSKIQEGHFLAYNIKNYNLFNSRYWDVPIEEGDILFFPGEITHEAKPYESKGERITIASSYYFKGKTGCPGNYNFINIGNNKK